LNIRAVSTLVGRSQLVDGRFKDFADEPVEAQAGGNGVVGGRDTTLTELLPERAGLADVREPS